LVGQAPGREEDVAGKPFVGKAGQVLDSLLFSAGIRREDIYITNVCKYYPPGDDLSKLPDIGVDYEAEVERTVREIKSLGVNVVVAAGDPALTALTGEKGITKWRGSILFGHELGKKVVPTLHPSYIMRGQWQSLPYVVADLKRVLDESTYPEVRRTPRQFCIHPTFQEALGALDRIYRSAEYCSFDIETMGRTVIGCIGLSDDPGWAICIPFRLRDGRPLWSEAEEVELWRGICAIMQEPRIKKVAQNAPFDIEWLIKLIGGYPRSMWLDTMMAHWLLYPDFSHKLHVITSIYTKEPYYKEDVKGEKEWGNVAEGILWEYNCKDAACTLEAAHGLHRDLVEEGLDSLYHGFLAPLAEVAWEMGVRGLRVDMERRDQLRWEQAVRAVQLRQEINELAGEVVNPGSPQQLAQLLYEKLGLPRKYHRKTGGVTTDEAALLELARKYKNPVLHKIVEYREAAKLYSTYYCAPLTPDERLVTEYVVPGTVTGRFSSRRRSKGHGTNIQNYPVEARAMAIPDPGKVFVKADLVQADAHVVAWLAGDEGQKAAFRSGVDIYLYGASRMYSVPMEQIDRSLRGTFKTTHHALNYGESFMGLARHLKVPASMAKGLRAQFFTTFPAIQRWHLEVERQLRAGRPLRTPFGWRRRFIGPFNNDMLRQALNFIPQHTVGWIINRALPILRYRLDRKAELMTQTHDEAMAQCRPEHVEEVKASMEEELVKKIIINGDEMEIPVEFKVMGRWG